MRVEVLHKLAGEPTLFPLFGGTAWDECKELQKTPRYVWLTRLISMAMSYSRIEVVVSDGVEYLGGCVLVREECDPHMGLCLSIFTQYVLPKHRHRGVSRLLMREAISLAKQLNYPTLAYSHRVRDYTYMVRYKDIHESNLRVIRE